MTKILNIKDADAESQEAAGMLNKNWHQILKAAMLKMGVTELDLPYSHLEIALEHPTDLSIQVNNTGFRLKLITAEEAQAIIDPNTDVIETDTMFAPKPHLNS